MKTLLITIVLFAAGTSIGCTTYVRPAPPVARVEVMPARPHAKAVWVKGHWKWKNRRAGYVWVRGHWKR